MKIKSIIALVIAGSLTLIIFASTVTAFPVLKPTRQMLKLTPQMLCAYKAQNLYAGSYWKWIPAKWTTFNGLKVYIPGYCKQGQSAAQ